MQQIVYTELSTKAKLACPPYCSNVGQLALNEAHSRDRRYE